MTPTFPYRVRPGAQLAHLGEVYDGGAVVQLTRQVGYEVRHLADPINDAGEVIDQPDALQAELEERPEHEHITILQRKRAALVLHQADLQGIAARTQATAAAAQKEVEDVTAAIAAIDAKLAPAPPAELEKPAGRAGKRSTSTPAPAPPAETKE